MTIEELKSSAIMGDADAQLRLGCLYSEGKEVKQDLAEAFKWIKLSAEKGNACAQHNLACFYDNDFYVKRDFEKVLFWLSKAANQGYLASQISLADIYLSSKEVAQDFNAAQKWFKEAAKQGDARSAYMTGCLLKEGQQPDYDETIYWLTVSAEHGYVKAQYELGRMYLVGEGVDSNPDKAFRLLGYAAVQGIAEAQFLYGMMISDGAVVDRDLHEAKKWIERAAKQGLKVATNYLMAEGGALDVEKKGGVEKNRDTKYLDDAKKLVEMGMPGPALMSCRNALEVLVKDLCKNCGMQYDSRELDLSKMIDSLYEANIIGTSIKDSLHRIRMKCNKGAHAEDVVSMIDAEEALKDITDAYEIVPNSISPDKVQQVKQIHNVPKANPDYYSRDRRYYGKWERCFTRQSLLVIPEYVELENRANDGDVEAMLDLAVGFLPKDITWSSNMLVNMPPFIHRKQAFNQDRAYDTRYYYWILKAVDTAWWEIESFPRKYISTAIWEGYKYWFYRLVDGDYYYVADVYEWYDTNTRSYHYQEKYGDQYALMRNMFALNDERVEMFDSWGMRVEPSEVACAIFENVKDCDFVAPIHEDAKKNPLFKIRFLRNCTYAMANTCLIDNEEDKYKLDTIEAEAINKDYSLLSEIQGRQIGRCISAGDIISWDMLVPYTIGAFCNEHYNLAVYATNKILKEAKKNEFNARNKSSGVKGVYRDIAEISKSFSVKNLAEDIIDAFKIK